MKCRETLKSCLTKIIHISVSWHTPAVIACSFNLIIPTMLDTLCHVNCFFLFKIIIIRRRSGSAT